MRRYIYDQILQDLDSKIVVITGPRQSGKTTFSKNLTPDYNYFNYDNVSDRLRIMARQWDRAKPLIVFDELHKHHQWKLFLKGIFDVEGIPPRLIVTGSAKLDVFRKVGDSLAGRFFTHHLFPLDLKEIQLMEPDSLTPATLAQFFVTSGFPEPFLKGSETFYKRWSRTHLDVILREDLQDLTTVRHVRDIETLIALLRSRTGNPISYSALARDLQVSPQTVKNWLILLENLYIIFSLTPYTKNVNRAIQKEPKYYFYDTAMVVGDLGAKLENYVAFSLHKWLHFSEDTTGKKTNLHYLRTRNGPELDFLITSEDLVTHVIEVKCTDHAFSKSFSVFQKQVDSEQFIQLVYRLDREYSTPTGVQVLDAEKWLRNFKL